MAAFTDAEGRNWSIVVTLATIDRIKSALGVDLLADPGAIGELGQDIRLCCNALYLCCEAQAKEAGITDEDFGRGMLGDAIENGTTAFLEALVDFFPSRRRANLRLILEKSGAVADKVMAKIESQMMDLDEDEVAETVLAQMKSGPTSGEPPESLE
jgi:hypothetical protein